MMMMPSTRSPYISRATCIAYDINIEKDQMKYKEKRGEF